MMRALLVDARQQPNELALRVVRDHGSAVDEDVAADDCRVSSEVLIFLSHPSFPATEGCLSVAIESPSESDSPRRVYPHREGERVGEPLARARYSFNDHDWCRLDLVPLGERLLVPVVPAVARGSALDERIDDTALETVPPFASRGTRSEVVSVNDRGVVQRLCEVCCEEALPGAARSVDCDEPRSIGWPRENSPGQSRVCLDCGSALHLADGAR